MNNYAELKFVDNHKAAMLSGDPTMDPGFDEFDIVDDEEEVTKMTLNDFYELKTKYSIYDDIENILDFVSELLSRRAREIEATEPYATRTIDDIDKAAYEVWDLIDYISELEEN
jgi:hypothetical protein